MKIKHCLVKRKENHALHVFKDRVSKLPLHTRPRLSGCDWIPGSQKDNITVIHKN